MTRMGVAGAMFVAVLASAAATPIRVMEHPPPEGE